MLQESNMNSSSKILNHIISCQISTNDKTGIGYKTETTHASTSTNKTGIETTNASISTTLEKIETWQNNISMRIGSTKQERNHVSMVQRRIYDRYQTRFDGYCFFCYKYGHKAIFCNGFSRSKYGRRTQNTVSNSYNSFDILNLELECYKCNHFGHIARKCPINFSKYAISKYTDLKTKGWKKKNQHLNIEDCNLALQENHKVKWCVDSGCSKYMTGRKHNFITLDEGKEGTVILGN